VISELTKLHYFSNIPSINLYTYHLVVGEVLLLAFLLAVPHHLTCFTSQPLLHLVFVAQTAGLLSSLGRVQVQVLNGRVLIIPRALEDDAEAEMGVDAFRYVFGLDGGFSQEHGSPFYGDIGGESEGKRILIGLHLRAGRQIQKDSIEPTFHILHFQTFLHTAHMDTGGEVFSAVLYSFLLQQLD
jgi:hypothetical protein